MRRPIILTVVLTLSVALTSQATIYRVKTDGNDNNDGLSWATAKQTISGALDGGEWFPDEVWVKAGTYNERFFLHAGERLYGGFAGTESNRNDRNPTDNVTVIDGTALSGCLVTFADFAYAGWETVDGFTIQNGTNTGGNGGGVYCTVPFTVNNCMVQECTAKLGGGIYCSGHTITLANTTIQNCTATGTGACGGGMYCGSYSSSTITGNTFDGNTAPNGAGIYITSSSPIISGENVFKQNHATTSGGAIYVASGSPLISGNIFEDGISGSTHNSASTSGGGIYVASGSTPTVALNNISGCTAVNGGAVYCAGGTVSGNLINSCSASSYGAGIYLVSTSASTYITNNTIADNTGDGVAAPSGTMGTVSNNICAFNTTGMRSSRFGMTRRNNDLYGNTNNYVGGLLPATGDIQTDPMFANHATSPYDYHLESGSSCINAGYNSASGIPSIDMDGQGRYRNITVDIGADEYWPTLPTPTFSPGGATHYSAQWVSMNCSESGSTIRFTTDESDPNGSSEVYAAPVLVDSNRTLKARASKSDWLDSAIGSASYVVTSYWNPDSDFSASSNPNGPWTFGSAPNLDSGYALTAYDTHSTGDGIDRWKSSTLDCPNVSHNPSEDPVALTEATWPPHTVALHPGQSDQKSIVRWTAPAVGTYTISARFWDITDGNTSTDVHVLQNGSSLFDGDITNMNEGPTPRSAQPLQSYSAMVLISQGDTIDFAVGYGNDDDYATDTTAVDISIGTAADDDTCKSDHGIDGTTVANINALGPDRSNIRWADPTTTLGYCDSFEITDQSHTNWVVDTLRLWVVPDVPVLPPYSLGDHFQSVTLYTAEGTTSALTARATGTLSAGSNRTDNPSVSITPANYSNGQSYLNADGTYSQLWRIDFNNLNWSVTEGQEYVVGMLGEPRIDRAWFVHAMNSDKAGWTTAGDDHFWGLDSTSLSASRTQFTGAGWFGGKESDINIQVFAHSATE